MRLTANAHGTYNSSPSSPRVRLWVPVLLLVPMAKTAKSFTCAVETQTWGSSKKLYFLGGSGALLHRMPARVGEGELTAILVGQC